MTPFFVLIFNCGYLYCDPPKQIDLHDEIACRQFIETFVASTKHGISAACFDRSTGKLLAASRTIYYERQKDQSRMEKNQ